jgi:hypothetical protein
MAPYLNLAVSRCSVNRSCEDLKNEESIQLSISLSTNAAIEVHDRVQTDTRSHPSAGD